LEERLRVQASSASAHLQDSHVLAAALISSPDNLIISRLKDGLILDISDSFTQTSGYRREEVVGRTVLDINLWADKEDRRQYVNLLRENGEVRGFQAHINIKDGRSQPFEISGRQVEIGREACVVSVSRDISEHRQHEIILRKRYRHS
jgi:PAS domain S-box-containing protein